MMGTSSKNKKNLRPDRCIGMASSNVTLDSWKSLHAGLATLPCDIHEFKKNTETERQW